VFDFKGIHVSPDRSSAYLTSQMVSNRRHANQPRNP